MSPQQRARLGDKVVESGLASRETVEEAALEAQQQGVPLGDTLVRVGGLDERDVYRALAEQRGLQFAGADELLAIADPALLNRFSRRYLDRQQIVPISIKDRTALLATCDPAAAPADIAQALETENVRLCVVTRTDYRRLRTALELASLHKEAAPHEAAAAGRDLLSADPRLNAELVTLFNAILLDAIGERASDIHLERYGTRVRVRIRVDGDLRDVTHYDLTPDQLLGLVNIVKIRSNLDIAERRMPQGGRFVTRAGGYTFDLRVQTQPALYGEHVVIRLLPHDQKLLGIEDLGFPEDQARQYRRLLDNPVGMVLVVGPTGSGKSTTLYAALQVLSKDPTRKVITVEDPIEYAIDGIQQTQVFPELQFTFANAMRVFVRQDPDVILVGEIRDEETALEAIRASQTGHLVFSTLHCNDAVDAVQRLIDLGMHPNSIASELQAVIAQRLPKRICTGCRAPAAPPPELLAEIFPDGPPTGFKCFKGKGCHRCGGYGTHGRIAVTEFLQVGERLRRAIAKRLSVDELREEAQAAGLVTLRDNALKFVEQGIIALEELRDLMPPEQLAGRRSHIKGVCACSICQEAAAAKPPLGLPAYAVKPSA
ncbi:MAG: ATPase, T2SS/T4P/T4SS family [Bdellovibrionota bacterium]